MLICNDRILKKKDESTKEKNKPNDSTYAFSLDEFENMGSTAFEITSTGENLKYRKTYTNDLRKTESEGILIKKAIALR